MKKLIKILLVLYYYKQKLNEFKMKVRLYYNNKKNKKIIN